MSVASCWCERLETVPRTGDEQPGSDRACHSPCAVFAGGMVNGRLPAVRVYLEFLLSGGRKKGFVVAPRYVDAWSSKGSDTPVIASADRKVNGENINTIEHQLFAR